MDKKRGPSDPKINSRVIAFSNSLNDSKLWSWVEITSKYSLQLFQYYKKKEFQDRLFQLVRNQNQNQNLKLNFQTEINNIPKSILSGILDLEMKLAEEIVQKMNDQMKYFRKNPMSESIFKLSASTFGYIKRSKNLENLAKQLINEVSKRKNKINDSNLSEITEDETKDSDDYNGDWESDEEEEEEEEEEGGGEEEGEEEEEEEEGGGEEEEEESSFEKLETEMKYLNQIFGSIVENRFSRLTLQRGGYNKKIPILNEKNYIEANPNLKKACYKSHQKYPWFGGEPDGISKDGKTIVEVKTSITEKNLQEKHLTKDGELKRNSIHYSQILGYVMIFDASQALLVIYSSSDPPEKKEVHVLFPNLKTEWKKLLKKLEEYYFCNYLPELLCRFSK